MDIAALSMNLHASQLSQNVGIAMVKKTMEVQEASMENLVEMLPPPSNHIIDVLA